MQEDKSIEEYVISEDADYKKERSWKDNFWNFIEGKYFITAVIILVAIIAFSLGRVSGLQDKRQPVRVISDVSGEVKGVATSSLAASATASASQGGQVVASKNGTKYHYPWCAGAKQISPQNLVTFNSTPGSSRCPAIHQLPIAKD